MNFLKQRHRWLGRAGEFQFLSSTASRGAKLWATLKGLLWDVKS
jgi:hypothetical protein